MADSTSYRQALKTLKQKKATVLNASRMGAKIQAVATIRDKNGNIKTDKNGNKLENINLVLDKFEAPCGEAVKQIV